VEGFHVKKKGEYVEQIKRDLTELSLLARVGGTEVMHQKIAPDRIVSISPGEEGTFEFFYILKGSLLWESEDGDRVINEGDFIYTYGLREIAHLKTLTEVEHICVCTQPMFKLETRKISEFMDILKRVEDKDVYTHNHGKRVQEYSVAIAKKLGLPKDRVEALLDAAIFHDIGKIYIPDEVLNKQGRLTDEEMEQIKQHPLYGKQLVEGTFLEHVGVFIIQHHERLDGSGYPCGAKGDDIMLESRIIAVADTFDAMTTDRPYKKGFSSAQAIAELKALVGKHYDEDVVCALEKALEEDKTLGGQ